MVCWGNNSQGQLGIESTVTVGLAQGDMGMALEPATLPPGLGPLRTSISHIQSTPPAMSPLRAQFWCAAQGMDVAARTD